MMPDSALECFALPKISTLVKPLQDSQELIQVLHSLVLKDSARVEMFARVKRTSLLQIAQQRNFTTLHTLSHISKGALGATVE